MQKTIKRIALLLVLAIAVTCMAVFASACGGDNNEDTVYAVQVICDDDIDLTQLSAQWCKSNEAGTASEGTCYGRPSTLDANGKALAQRPTGGYYDLNELLNEAKYGFHVQLNYGTIELSNSDFGYTYAEGQNLHITGPGTLIIKIVKVA